jgi:pimeloyl-ACP methyl ester carboxylesterase
MTTYVLVHGAWHGGWCWRSVKRGLQDSGSDVYTPTLTALGERAHLASPGIGLETHIRDVLGVLEFDELTDVVLVAHSYGGIVCTAVADQASERIARLVYLDAVVPRDSQCLFDCVPERLKVYFEEQAKVGGGWQIPAEAVSAQFLGLTRDDDIRWVLPKLTSHPLRTFRERVRLGSTHPPIARSYINCIGDKPFGQAKTRQADEIDDYRELRTGHDAMVTAPMDVVALLLDVVRVANDSAELGAKRVTLESAQP